jgi:UDP-N-acetylglucosamine/UDP-N-acetylgalactosamine 4-epimerase
MYSTPFHDKNLSNYSFLITGGAGFIGSNLIEYLVKYRAGKIRVLDNLATGFEENLKAFNDNIEFINGDITQFTDCKKACEGMDIVLHQAALGSVPRSIEFPLATNEANVTGFINMLTAAKDARIKRFVYASSSSVYGDSKALPKVEENIGNQLSPYAVSKRVNELYASVFHKTYGLETVGLRYFNIFGPRQNPKGAYAAAIPLFMDALLENQSPLIFGDGEQTRDFTFVENAVQANIKAAFTEETGAIGEIFNVAYSQNVSINEMFSIIKKLTSADCEPLYRPERQGDVRNSLADISKAGRLLGYDPKISFEEGIKITLDWFASYKKRL